MWRPFVQSIWLAKCMKVSPKSLLANWRWSCPLLFPTVMVTLLIREIFSSILIDNECIHSSRQPRLALQSDFQKAYVVAWNFSESIPQRMNFGLHWHKIIMEWASSTSCSVLLCGFQNDTFKVLEGFQQGCPSSPFLFFRKDQALICGFKVPYSKMKVSHLHLTNDMIYFETQT